MDTRATIIDATLSLLADRPFEEVTLRAIAREAGISLSELAAAFPTRGDILAAYTRRVDEAVLSGAFDDMADQPPRERLFDVLMTRIETLRPNRDAIASLMHSARKDPQLALFLNAQQLVSMRWMLEAASITPTGWQGRAAVQALAISFAKVLRVFVKEDDVGLPRTMAALDKELRAAEARYLRLARFFGRGVHAEPASAAPDAAEPASDPTSAHASPPAPSADAGGADTAAFANDEAAAAAASSPPVDPPAANDDDGKETPNSGTP